MSAPLGIEPMPSVGTLRALGPDAEYLGEDAGFAATYDLAMLDVFSTG